MANKKNINPTAKTDDLKISYSGETRLDMYSFRKYPVSEGYVEDLSKKMIKWVIDNPGALLIEEFYEQEGIYCHDAIRWGKRFPNFEMARKHVLMILGTRREKGGLGGKMDKFLVNRTQAHYLDYWKDLEEWRSKLNIKDEEGSVPPRVIYLEKFPSSDSVPPKPEE